MVILDSILKYRSDSTASVLPKVLLISSLEMAHVKITKISKSIEIKGSTLGYPLPPSLTCCMTFLSFLKKEKKPYRFRPRTSYSFVSLKIHEKLNGKSILNIIVLTEQIDKSHCLITNQKKNTYTTLILFCSNIRHSTLPMLLCTLLKLYLSRETYNYPCFQNYIINLSLLKKISTII